MKKRLIISTTLLTIFSLIIFLIISSIIVMNQNTKSCNDEIKSYSVIASSMYDGSNYESISNVLKKSNHNIRITFIQSDGTVLYDSDSMTEDNHLDRPEIQNIGTVYSRHSATLNKNMIYVAKYIDSYSMYVRISIPESSAKTSINQLLLYGTLVIVLLSLSSGSIIYYIVNKNLKPLKEETKKLSTILNTDTMYETDDLEELSYQIDSVYNIISSKMNEINREKTKLEYVLKNMNQGLIIINDKSNIESINEYALTIFNRQSSDVVNKPYNYLFINKQIDSLIESSLKTNQLSNYYLEIDNKFYLLTISSIFSFEKKMVSIFMLDITDEKKAQKMKLDFFSNASHELKSPLTSIIGYQELIKEGIICDKDEIDESVDKTIKEARRMNQIIIEMLELSRLESNTKKEKTHLSIKKIVEDVVSSLTIEADNKHISTNIDGINFSIFMNNDEAYQLIKNLYDNAIKYNKDNGSINISYKDNEFIISDSGIGISQYDQARIFERFYRVDKARSKESGGTGLGLSIVKYICINSNIAISVSSELNKGTTFKLIFNQEK